MGFKRFDRRSGLIGFVFCFISFFVVSQVLFYSARDRLSCGVT